MESTLNKTKVAVLKKMLGKRVFVVTNSLLDEGYCGIVNQVVNHETVQVISEKKEEKVSIFDIRTPSRIYDCE
jgi:hypothetical protein